MDNRDRRKEWSYFLSHSFLNASASESVRPFGGPSGWSEEDLSCTSADLPAGGTGATAPEPPRMAEPAGSELLVALSDAGTGATAPEPVPPAATGATAPEAAASDDLCRTRRSGRPAAAFLLAALERGSLLGYLPGYL